MKTQAFPIVEIEHYTYEIGEFDCASIILLVGDERAMLIDPTPNPKFPARPVATVGRTKVSFFSDGVHKG